MISGTFGSLVIIGVGNYLLLIPLVIIAILVYIPGKYYIIIVPNLRRLEATSD